MKYCVQAEAFDEGLSICAAQVHDKMRVPSGKKGKMKGRKSQTLLLLQGEKKNPVSFAH